MINLGVVDMRGNKIYMSFSLTTTLEEVHKDISHRLKLGYYPILKCEGAILKPDSNERLIDLGIENGNVILTNKPHHGGGDSIEFCDVSNGKQELINSNIIYGTPNKGINIYGFCKEKNCIAYNKEVVVPINKNYFDLLSEKHDLKCPKCNNIIIPNTVGFLQCEYKVKGKKLKNCEEFNFKEIADKSGKYYNSKENINGKAEMVQLNFEVTKYL